MSCSKGQQIRVSEKCVWTIGLSLGFVFPGDFFLLVKGNEKGV